MMSARKLNLNGLEIKGDEATSPRTEKFLTLHKMHVKKKNGRAILTGGFCLPGDDVKEFLKDKDKYIEKHNL